VARPDASRDNPGSQAKHHNGDGARTARCDDGRAAGFASASAAPAQQLHRCIEFDDGKVNVQQEVITPPAAIF